MKRSFPLTLLVLLALVCPSRSADRTGTLDFPSLDVPNVLSFYKKLTGVELIVDSRAKAVHSTITLHVTSPVSKDEAAKRIEQALIKQTGVVITRLDDKQASVTFNDALPLSR